MCGEWKIPGNSQSHSRYSRFKYERIAESPYLNKHTDITDSYVLH